jgi:hypothetical protein
MAYWSIAGHKGKVKYPTYVLVNPMVQPPGPSNSLQALCLFSSDLTPLDTVEHRQDQVHGVARYS